MKNKMKGLFTFLLFIVISNLSAQGDTVQFNVGCVTDEVGSSHCVDVTVANFTDITNYQYSISFDATVIEFESIDLSSTCLSGLSLGEFNDGPSSLGWINTIWSTPDGVPHSCPDGSVLFSMCYKLIGDPGDCASIVLDDTGIEMYIENDSGEVPFEINTCDNCVVTSDLTIVADYCENDLVNSGGSIKFYATGGTGPYSFSVDHASNSNVDSGVLSDGQVWSMDGLPQGIYTISVTDADGNMTSININITQNFPIEYTLDVVQPRCFKRHDGVVAINGLTGGQNPYSIAWSNNKFNVMDIDDLSAGFYTVTVTDLTGCEAIKTVQLSVDTLKVEVEVIDSFHCKGGRAEVLFRGVNGYPKDGTDYAFNVNGIPYPYQPNLTLMDNLLPVNTVYVTDDANPDCASDVVEFSIPTKHEMTINEEYFEDVACKGDVSGRIRINAEIEGETNFIFQHVELPSMNIVPGTAGPNVYFNDNMGAGSYAIYIQSINNSCKDTLLFDITEPDEFFTIDSMVTYPTCSGNDGRIEILANGGEPDYTYDWGIPSETTNVLDNLNGGDFKVVVEDEAGCKDSLEFNMPMGGDLFVDAAILNAITCFGGNNGSVIANVSPPGTYTYEWTDEDGMVIGDMLSVENLSEGMYYVEVSQSGCTAMDSVFLSQPSPILVDDIVITDPECAGETGSIGVVVSGGFPGYDYIWTEVGETTVLGVNSVLLNVGEGSYQVVITDQEGCSLDTFGQIKDAPKIDLDVSSLVGVGCSGDATGQATATASGGSQGATMFNYLWSSGEMGDMASNLPAGKNWVIAADNRCVSDTVFFTIPDASPVGALEQITSPDCVGDCNGMVTLIPSGGTMTGFVATWPSLGQNGLTINNLCAGSYDYVLSDSEGCMANGTVVITEPDTLKLAIDETITQGISCKTGTGQIGVKATGGNGGYSYTWDGSSSTTFIAEQLAPGTYTVTVTDAKGCEESIGYTLDPLVPITAVINPPVEPNCFGGLTCIRIVSASGGVGGPYSFQINSGIKYSLDTCVSVFAGQYLINVFDAAGCSFETTISIDQPNPIVVNIGDDIEVDLGAEPEIIMANIDHDFPIDSLLWTTLDPYSCDGSDCETISISPVEDQEVTLYVEDVNGCHDSDELLITVNDVRHVYFPNVFSPNGDGANEAFQVVIGPGVEMVNEFLIYDRWGNKMYEQSNFVPSGDPSEGWNGQFNGDYVPPGVYVYMVKVTFIDGRVLDYAGDVTVLR